MVGCARTLVEISVAISFFFSRCDIIISSCKLALRVPPAVTRLTVYRWLHIPAQNTWPGGPAGNELVKIYLFLWIVGKGDDHALAAFIFALFQMFGFARTLVEISVAICFLFTRCDIIISSCKLALQVPPAVTRLTVYRWLHYRWGCIGPQRPSIIMYGATTLDWCQLLIPLIDLNEINIKHGLYMYLDSCKGASLCMDLARSYASARVRLMRADLWKIRISSFEVLIRLRIEVSEANFVCWRTMLSIVTRRASSVWAWTRRVIPVRMHRATGAIHNYVWRDHAWLMSALDSSDRFKWD